MSVPTGNAARTAPHHHKPKRIQRRRSRGWRMPEGAVYVGRPTNWGNPFRPLFLDGEWWAQDDNDVRYPLLYNTRDEAIRKCVSLYHSELVQWSEKHMLLPELRGRDLVCWCPLINSHDEYVTCHADVLLSIANDIPIDEVVRENTRRATGKALR